MFVLVPCVYGALDGLGRLFGDHDFSCLGLLRRLEVRRFLRTECHQVFEVLLVRVGEAPASQQSGQDRSGLRNHMRTDLEEEGP